MKDSSRSVFLVIGYGLLCLLAMANFTHMPGRLGVPHLYKPASLEREFVKGGPRADKPAEAQEYYRAKRAPIGETAVPVGRYLSAQRQMRNMPVYSTASDLMAPEGMNVAAAQALSTWEELGPGNVGGRTRGLVIDPGNADVMYAGGVAGGVWKTTNGGSSWSALDDLMANLAVASLAMDPSNSSVLYAGTGEGIFNFDAVRGAGIFKTTDGGASWNHLTSTNNSSFYYVNDVVVSPNSSQRVYAATRTGIWRSLNGGTSWSQVVAPGTSNGCLDLAVRSDSANDVVFASCGGTFSDATVYRNPNAGGGGAWSAVLTEASLGRTSLSIAPSNQDVIYALSASLVAGQFHWGLHAVFRSTDGGVSWTARVRNSDPTPMNRMLLTNSWWALCAGSFFNQGWYDNVIAVDPVDPDIVWAGGVDLFRSDDGGQNWGYAGRNAHVDQHALAFHPGYDGASNKTLFAGNDGGIYRTLDSRAGTDLNVCSGPSSDVTWSSLNNNYGVTQFYHGAPYPDGQTYFGGTQDNGTIRGNDTGGAQNWQAIMGGDGGYVAVDPTNTNILYAEFQNWAIRKSTNGGASFSNATNGISDSGLFITPFIMDPSNSQRLWTGGRFVWRTVNGASNWTQASTQLGSTVSALAVSPTNPNRVLVGLTNGRIHQTDVALGASSLTAWPSNRPRSGFVSSLAFHPEDEMTAYATYSTFGGVHVWKSTNGGASWNDLDGSGSTGIPDIPSHSIVVDPVAAPVGSHLYVGTDLGVFTSIDAGATWAVENTGFANVVTETLALDASQTRLFAFTHGRGAFRVDLLQGDFTPRAPSPVDGAVEVDHTPTLTWIAGASTYDIYFGTSSNPPLVSTSQIESSYVPGMLDLTTTYYWKVVSRDSLGTETPGPLWSFTTADQCSERVTDGSFEGGAAGPAWTQVSTNFGTPLCDPNTCGVTAARTGDWWIWFGGTSTSEQGSVEQTVNIPLGAATLSFYLWINNSSGNGVDGMRVLIDGQEIFSALEGNPTYTGGYVQVVLNVDAFADGGTHTLRLESTITGSPVGSNFMVDDVTLDGCVGLLAAPNLVSPLVDATNDTTPTFTWGAVTDAVNYRLVVDNLTSGGTPIDITTGGTSFTPAAALPAGNFYQWRAQAIDAGAVPGASSPPMTLEIDTQAPPAVTLFAQLPSGLSNLTDLDAIDASSEWTSNGGARQNIVDGDPATKWQSTSKSSVTTEFVTIDLGGMFSVARIRLLASPNDNTLLFPKGFQLQVSDQPSTNYTTVRTEANFVAQQGIWYDFDADPVLSGRYVRVWITDTNFYVNKFPYNALIAEVEVLEDSAAFGTIVYSWEAPADDAGGGTEPVVTYDLRLGSDEFPFNYTFAGQIGNEPIPAINGTQTVTVTGLPGETGINAAMTSIDDAGNRSLLSNIVFLATPGVPPAVITNLRAFSPTKTSVELDWDAPAEDGPSGGKVTSYEVRYSESPIGAGNFASAMLVTDEVPPTPQDPGTTQSMTVNNLSPTTDYYFAIISRDDVGNV